MAVEWGLLNQGNPTISGIKTPFQGMQDNADLTAKNIQNAFAPKLNQQQVALNDVTIQKGKIDQALQQNTLLANAAAYLQTLPSDDQVNSEYQKFRSQYGNVFPNLPQTLNKQEAQSAYNMALSTTDKLNMLKSQIELATMQSNIGYKNANLQVNALKNFNDAYTQGSPYAGSFLSYINGLNNAGSVPATAGGQADTTAPANTTLTGDNVFTKGIPYALQPVQQGQQGQPAPQNMPSMPQTQQTNNNVSTPQIFPGVKKGAEDQADAWQKFVTNTASSGQTYGQLKTALNSIRHTLATRTGGSIAGLAPDFVMDNTESGQKINKDSNLLQTNLVKSLTSSGIQRLDIPIVNMIKGSTPEAGKYNSVNYDIINKYDAANEVGNNIAPKIVMQLNKEGVRDPLVAQNVINEVINRSGLYEDPNGNIDPSKLKNWQPIFKQVMDELRSGKSQLLDIDQNQQSNTNQQQPQQQTQASTMPQLSQADREALKAQHGLTDAQLDQALKLQMGKQQAQPMQQTPSPQMPSAQPPSMVNPQAQPQANQSQINSGITGIKPLADAIAHVESGGNYMSISKPSKDGDRAYGKYQIMGKNIPVWTREALGTAMSVHDFLLNPQAQEAVAQVKLGQLMQKYGNPADVASAWFSGRPARNNNSRDVYGTSVPQYVRAVQNFMNRSSNANTVRP